MVVIFSIVLVVFSLVCLKWWCLIFVVSGIVSSVNMFVENVWLSVSLLLLVCVWLNVKCGFGNWLVCMRLVFDSFSFVYDVCSLWLFNSVICIVLFIDSGLLSSFFVCWLMVLWLVLVLIIIVFLLMCVDVVDDMVLNLLFFENVV